jgi:putative flippase GtrA
MMLTVSKQMQKTVRQLIKFHTVGCLNTLLDIGLYLILTKLGVAYMVAQCISYAGGTLNSYAMNKRWTFRTQANPAQYACGALFRFLTLNAVSFGISSLVLTQCLYSLGWSNVTSKLAATCAGMLLQFIGNKYWVFRERKPVFQDSINS